MTPTSTPSPSLGRTATRIALGSALAFAGAMHLTKAREEFQAQVPTWVPLPADDVVVMSGVLEVCLGSALVLLPKEQHRLGWVVAAFFTAIFPGNIAQYTERRDAFGLDSDRKRALRLLGQPLLVAAALWSTRRN
ncbi:DoxX family protein [Quadrisphaera sp. KR29]|uniref:DoxX family protein n=1 Tax=Quadrisphaera sp. KR29 TaxID=3461391 RepID=UPI00404397AD